MENDTPKSTTKLFAKFGSSKSDSIRILRGSKIFHSWSLHIGRDTQNLMDLLSIHGLLILKLSCKSMHTVVSYAVSLQRTHQSDAASNHSHLSGRLAAPGFVINCTDVRAVWWLEVWKFYGSLHLLHFPTGGSE